MAGKVRVKKHTKRVRGKKVTVDSYTRKKSKRGKRSRGPSIRELNREFNKTGIDIYGNPSTLAFEVTPANFNITSGRGMAALDQANRKARKLSGKRKRSPRINLRDYQLNLAQSDVRKEERDRKIYGVPKRVKKANLPKSVQQRIADEELASDIESYNLLVRQGENPEYLRKTLRDRGINV